MTQLWRNSLEVLATIDIVMLCALILHLVMSWLSAPTTLH